MSNMKCPKCGGIMIIETCVDVDETLDRSRCDMYKCVSCCLMMDFVSLYHRKNRPEPYSRVRVNMDKFMKGNL